MFGIFKKKNRVESFWNWFVENESTLRNFETIKTKLLIRTQSNKIVKGLIFELTSSKNGVLNITISSGGIKDLFSNVEELFEKAPKIDGWNFIKFRQRIPKNKIKGMILKSDEYQLNPSNMKYKINSQVEALDITIFIKGITQDNRDQISYGSLVLLDKLLGEYDCVMKIEKFDFREMPSNIQEAKVLKPLLKLVEDVDRLKVIS